MLGPGRYLLGVAGDPAAGRVRLAGGGGAARWLLPRFEGAPAQLATAVLALALLIWPAELLGTFGAFKPVPYLLLVVVCRGWALEVLRRGRRREGGRTHTC